MIKNNPGRRIILLQFLILIILAVTSGGCAQSASVSNTAAQTETAQKNTVTIPKTDREQVSKFITPREASNLIKANQNNPYFVIIDDRTPGEYGSGHIARAMNVPASRFTAGVSSMDKSKIYLTYCRTGCGAASSQMKTLGFKEVYDIKGGFEAWVSDGLPIEK